MTRYIATFEPQAWVNDNAITVDAEGPTEWDATEYVQAFLREPDGTYTVESAARWLDESLEHGDYDDHLRTDPNAPKWVREWAGPFETYLREADIGDEVDAVLDPVADALRKGST